MKWAAQVLTGKKEISSFDYDIINMKKIKFN
jgi:hypothetical protein